ncbi:NAD-dependent epimerase/dehydratase family protein [Amaricoccus solimangrovi]|uniref:NAD-dependent epimerase/dehydratase family protein n=1 Tax=Amaricoccus solimangrovi TaxID=2589815 RepID=A0A501WVC4_9RHOB|nr:NAD-dependent epimerase/dehydratase family protein [Amaricoccus solimangrovi]TPE53713.1 NAD-dependent epimerase/dehydratase family protein [Amaricoccus solimangrovi]
MADIVVFGGDGYIGWPLALELATSHPQKKVLIVDNYLTRAHAEALEGGSLLPIRPLPERVAAYRDAFELDNLDYLELDCANSDQMTEFMRSISPEVVYHLAHQRAAPYSMLGLKECVETITNNEVGFLNLIWLLRDYHPNCHLVKLGSFGAYAKAGLDIPEGNAVMSCNGKTSAGPMPFPRASDDFYHITKINDGNFAGLAARKWGLRVTDVMQSTVFGAMTDKTLADERMHTRFDYDEILGTVLNRFCAQALCGVPLTVYGLGTQTSGIMTLEHCIAVLVSLADAPCAPGTHRIINNCPKVYSINELAEMVRLEGTKLGLNVKVARNRYNPRFEDGVSHDYSVETSYLSKLPDPMPMRLAVARSLEVLGRHRDQIRVACVEPRHDWMGTGGAAQAEEPVAHSG